MTRPGRSQITPEPALPIEPRTSTTLRAISRASSANAVEICSAPMSTSASVVMLVSTLVRPRGRDDGNLAQIAATNQLDRGRSADRVWAEGHLERFAVLDGATADGQHNVA